MSCPGYLGEKNGRGERIRTSDHLHPIQVRYQTALRPDCTWNYTKTAAASQHNKETVNRASLLSLLRAWYNPIWDSSSP